MPKGFFPYTTCEYILSKIKFTTGFVFVTDAVKDGGGSLLMQ